MALVVGGGATIITARLQGWNGTAWENVSVTNEGKLYIQPYIYDSGEETLTSTGAGTEVDTEVGVIAITWQQINNASSANPDIRLQGSIDGTNWFDLDISTSIGSEMRHVVNKPVRYYRVNVVSLGDATQVTVRAWGIR